MKLKLKRAAFVAFACLGVARAASAAPAANERNVVQRFSLGDVQLLDGPFKKAMELNAAYLLKLEPDRLLHNTREYCGLKPKAERYAGWESAGVAGHILGHYLTALSQQYAATGDKRFRDRIDYIVSEMAECQVAYKDGYIGALPPKELETLRGFQSGKVHLAGGGFDFAGGAWVPWYTEHKILAGLLDAYEIAGNPQAKAVAVKLADWVDLVTKKLPPDQLTLMLRVEHGGMLEALTRISVLTGDKKYLDVAKRFYNHEIFDPLADGKDDLTGRHANTQIPKIIGEALSYEVTGDETGKSIAENFWDIVVNHRSYANGGNSDGEHFFPVGKAIDHLDASTAETCNTYNMLKLTEHLFQWQPRVAVADYYERALYNHILGSQEPKQGMFTYFVSLKPGLFKTYSTPFDSFWCCVGTGMENHTKYGDAIYFHNDQSLYLNLFIPSTLTWKQKGLVLEQKTEFPNKDFTELTVKQAPNGPVKLMVRCPAWTSAPVAFQLNGQPLDVKAEAGQYAEVSREWKQGDVLRVTTPMGLRTEKLEGNDDVVALFYGPILLAGDLGPEPTGKTIPYAPGQGDNFHAATADVPTLVKPEGGDILASIRRVDGDELTFKSDGLGKPDDVTFRPFSSIYYDRYNVYWRLLSPTDWQAKEQQMAAEKAKRQQEEARIVDEFSPGEQQSEVDHKFKSDRSRSGDFGERKWRDAMAGGFFEYEMKTLADQPMTLRCTFWGDDQGNREFDILVDGKVLATQKLEHNKPGEFFDVEFPLPDVMTTGKSAVTVRFAPHDDQTAGGLFHSLMLKPDAGK